MPETNNTASTSNYYVYGTNLKNKEYFTSTVKTETGIKRYFSNIDAEIYFGDKNVTEDICEFRFSVEEKQLPIYSYNKFYPDIIVSGQRIVQGTFALNFTNGTYIRDLLSEIDNSVLNTSYFDEELYNPGQIDNNHALWNKSFDIVLGYGDYKADEPGYGSTTQTLCGVKITNLEKGFGTDGKPILDIYTFIAKTFSESDDILNNSEKENEEITDNENTDNTTNDDNTNNDNTENTEEDVVIEEFDPLVKHEVYYTPLTNKNTKEITAILVSDKINVMDKKYKFTKNVVIEISTEDLYDYYMSKGRGYENERKYLQSCSNIITLTNNNQNATDYSDSNAAYDLSSNLISIAHKESYTIQPEDGKEQESFNYHYLKYSQITENMREESKEIRPLYNYIDAYFSDNMKTSLNGHIKYSYEYENDLVEIYEPIEIKVNERYVKEREDAIEKVEDEIKESIGKMPEVTGSNGDFAKASKDSTIDDIILRLSIRDNTYDFYKNGIKYRYSKTATLTIPDPKVLNINGEWNDKNSNVITLERKQSSYTSYNYIKKIEGNRPIMINLRKFLQNQENYEASKIVSGNVKFSIELETGEKKDYSINVEFYNRIFSYTIYYEDGDVKDQEWMSKDEIKK